MSQGPHRYPFYGTTHKSSTLSSVLITLGMTLVTGYGAYKVFMRSEAKRKQMAADYKPLNPDELVGHMDQKPVDEEKLKRALRSEDDFIKAEIAKRVVRNVEDFTWFYTKGVQNKPEFMKWAHENFENIKNKGK